MPTYDTDSYRRRRLAELDRAAESGRVPTALLARWEHALEDVALWRFAPTCVHGDLTGDQVLAVFEDDADASTGRIRGLTGWEDAKVADPADDFASLVDEADPAALETVARGLRPRPGRAPGRQPPRPGAAGCRARHPRRPHARRRPWRRRRGRGPLERLRRLDEEVHAEDPSDDYRRTSLTPVALRARATPAAGRGRRRGRRRRRGVRAGRSRPSRPDSRRRIAPVVADDDEDAEDHREKEQAESDSDELRRPQPATDSPERGTESTDEPEAARGPGRAGGPPPRTTPRGAGGRVARRGRGRRGRGDLDTPLVRTAGRAARDHRRRGQRAGTSASRALSSPWSTSSGHTVSPVPA